MRTSRFPILALPLLLAACEDRTPPQPIEPEGWPDPVITETTQQVPLQEMAGTQLTGELIVTPFPDSVIFHVSVNDGAPETNLPVRVMEGTCEAPSREIAVLEAVRTGALGNGRSQRTLQEDPHRLLDGMHVVAVFGQAARPEQDRPLACAPIPAMAR
jgi:hypothetical protein